MKYRIHLDDEDYILFNIFHIKHSKTEKRSINILRMTIPFMSLIIVILSIIQKEDAAFAIIKVVVLLAISVLWIILMPKLFDKIIRKNLMKMKQEGKLPYTADSELEFQDSVLAEKSERGEFRVKYSEIEKVYAQKDVLYLYFGATQAFILPKHCLEEDWEQVKAYITEKTNLKILT